MKKIIQKWETILEQDNGKDITYSREVLEDMQNDFKLIFNGQYCNKCGNKTMLMSGVITLEPDQEPYENGIEEGSKTGIKEVDKSIIAHFCENCDEIINTFNK